MALVEVARFWDLAEARIAQSALDAAGFTTIVFDEHRASAVWNEQLALGGIRLMAPEAEAADARSLLQTLRPVAQAGPAAKDEQPERRMNTAAALLACFVFGWPLAGLKRTGLFHRASAIALIVVGLFGIGLMLVATR